MSLENIHKIRRAISRLQCCVKDLKAGNTYAETLTQTLAAGNVTGGNNIIMTRASADYIISDDGVSNIIIGAPVNPLIAGSTDNAAYTEAWFYGTTTKWQSGFGTSFLEANLRSIFLERPSGSDNFSYISEDRVGVNDVIDINTILYSIAVGDNTGAISFEVENDRAVILNSGSATFSTTFNAGVDRSVAVGGQGITVKTPDSAYANKIALCPSNSASEIVISPGTPSADRTQVLKDATGIVALTIVAADIIGDGTTTDFVITHNLNNQFPTFTMYDAGTPFALSTAYNTVEATSVNTLTVKFAVAPAVSTDYKVSLTG